MALILADTDVLIDFLTGIQPVKDQIASYINSEQLKPQRLPASELLSGAGENKRGRASANCLMRLRCCRLIVPPLNVRPTFAASLSNLAKQLEWVTV